MHDSIKAVLFDVDGTLYNQTLLRIIMAFRIILSSIVFPLTASRNMKIIKYYRKSQEILREKKISVSNLAFEQIKLTSELTGVEISIVKEVVAKWFNTIPLKILPVCKRKNLYKTFKWLVQNNFKIGLFSDYLCVDKARALKIDKYICICLSSMDEDIGSFKPDQKGFLVACKKLGFLPVNILFVGDRVEVDLIGANSVGMRAAILGKISYGDKKNFSLSNLIELIDILKSNREKN